MEKYDGGIFMRRFWHYCNCAIKILKKNYLDFIRSIKFSLRKFFVYIKLRFRHKEFQADIIPEDINLQKYHEDIGRLSLFSGFTQEPILDLSIIIPMYNIEKFITPCINSVLNQKTKYSYEILLVDDGSTDNSLKEVESFLSLYNIKLFTQANMGQSVARNFAISESLGRYLMFLDGDDLLIDGSIELMLDYAVKYNADIVEGKIQPFVNKHEYYLPKSVKGKKYKIQSYEKNSNFVLSCNGYSPTKIYRRYMWETLRFPEGYIFEDIITKFILRRKANKVVFLDDVVYGYRRNIVSSSHGKNPLKNLDSIWVFTKIEELCKRENVGRDGIFYFLALNHIGILNYITIKNQDSEVKQACFLEMKKQLEGIQDSKPKKVPFVFKVLEKSILFGSISDWEYVASIIMKYGFAKKWREIN